MVSIVIWTGLFLWNVLIFDISVLWFRLFGRNINAWINVLTCWWQRCSKGNISVPVSEYFWFLCKKDDETGIGWLGVFILEKIRRFRYLKQTTWWSAICFSWVVVFNSLTFVSTSKNNVSVSLPVWQKSRGQRDEKALCSQTHTHPCTAILMRTFMGLASF